MAANDDKMTADDYGCHPWEEMKDAHDKMLSGEYPEEPSKTTTKKLMRPQTEQQEG